MEKFDINRPFDKISFSRIKKYPGQIFALLFVFLLIAGISIGIGLINPSFLYLTIPLTALPALFSLQVSINFLIEGRGISNKASFGFFLSYFSSQFKGCYRVVLTFFKSLLVYVVFSLIVAISYYYIAINVSPTFKESLDQVASLLQNDGFNSIEKLFENNDLLLFYHFSQGIPLLFSSLYFCHNILLNSLNVHIRSRVGSVSPSALNSLFSFMVRSDKKLFYWSFVKRNWPGYLFYGIGFILGYLLSFFLFPNMPTFAICFALFFAIFFLCFYLPFTFISSDLFIRNNDQNIKKFFIEFSLKSLEELKKTSIFTNEQINEAFKNIKEVEKSLDDAKKEQNEDKEEKDSIDSKKVDNDSSNNNPNGNEKE
ncbi:MAG TPA: hypothetical protein DD377_04635 [Firmicutes bacterium]|nr:hypothetical protein [Bacillota bacterium]